MQITQRLKSVLGLDRSIAYTVLARCFQIVGSTGTVLLIVHFLTPLEQGYYYTILSLVGLQTIFELGFSFVVLQLAAHECVHLTINSSTHLHGDPVACSRLASILQKTTRWYLVIAAVMGLMLMPLGLVFFSRREAAGQIAWQGPWVLAVLACVAAFLLGPVFAFLEGCGQVREIALVRMKQALAAIVAAWSAMIFHHGLYSPALVLIGYLILGIVFLWSRRGFLLHLLRYSAKGNEIAWRTEVWGFQWKIAVTWLCSYFTLQAFTPILFAFRGPVEAGRVGMSISIAGYLWNIVFPWMSTKAAPFGRMIASRQFEKLDRIFFRTLRQSLAVLVIALAGLWIGLSALQAVSSNLTSRLMPLGLFGLLLLATISTYTVQSFGIYLRAHKAEPLLWQSVLVASLTILGAFVSVPRWGMVGASVTYFMCTGVIGALWAGRIFHLSRRRRSEATIVVAGPTIIPLQQTEEHA